MKARLQTLISALRSRKRTGLVACVVAGDPDAEATSRLLRELPAAGADALELVIPFSDPVADGPVLASGHRRALCAGQTLEGTFALAERLRRTDSVTPLLLMGYLNPVLPHGPDAFFSRVAESGADGVVLVDLPLEHRGPWETAARARGVALLGMWAPTADEERSRRVLEASDTLAYLVTRTGTTGRGAADPAELCARARWARANGAPALMAGFGIRSREQLAALEGEVELAVVASRLVEELEAGGEDAVARVLSAVRELSGRA
jgi:tryptophan synthase alpha chain